MKRSEKNLGLQGENWAETYLIGEGYMILERNYRYRKAELDIIAKKKDLLVVVEVKTRSENFMVPLAETINQKKIALLVSAADHYITSNNLDNEVRFDVLAITTTDGKPDIEHLPDAFYHF